MQEYAHHRGWLNEIQEQLNSAKTAQIGEEARRYMLAVCTRVLEQNPTSEYARETMERVRKLCGAPLEEKTVESNPLRRDVKDLVTGETVINIEEIPTRHSQSMRAEFIRAEEQTRNGGVMDIRRLVETCDKEGPFPGFAEILTPQERAQLSQAGHALCVKCNRAFTRNGFGGRVDRNTTQMDAALKEHIVPFLPYIKSADALANVKGVLKLWDGNMGNPYKNFYHRSNHLRSGDPEALYHSGTALLQHNVEHFSVGVVASGNPAAKASAEYDPLMRTILFKDADTQGYDFGDALGVVHELTHVAQHTRFIRKFGADTPEAIERSHKLYTSNIAAEGFQASAVLEEECEAFANMFDMLFTRMAHGSLNPQHVCNVLGIAPTKEKIKSVNTWLQLSNVYFINGGRKGNTYPPAFVRAVEGVYEWLGNTIFTLSPEGIPVLKKKPKR